MVYGTKLASLLTGAVLTAVVMLSPLLALAHCDTLDGPVVADAREALAAGDIAPVLKWTLPAYEQGVRDAFDQALQVRALGPEARELADTYFFETLVRLHREGEGAPYTGLKPAGTPLSPGVAGADRALEQGALDVLEAQVVAAVRDGMRERFAEALEAKQTAGADAEAGREFVRAYVEFMHYVERLEADAAGAGGHEHSAAEAEELHAAAAAPAALGCGPGCK